MGIKQEDIRRERALEAENKRLDALNDEYIRTISEQAAVIRDLKLEKLAFTANVADEIRKLEGQVEYWIESSERNLQNWHEVHDREIVMGEKIKRLKEYADSIDMSEMCFEVRQLMIKIYDLC